MSWREWVPLLYCSIITDSTPSWNGRVIWFLPMLLCGIQTFNYKMASCLLSWREKSLGITTIWFLKPLGLNPGTIILLTVFRFKSVLHSTQSWERLYLSRQNYRSYKTYCSMLVQFLNSHVSETDLYHSCSDLQVDKSPSADSDKGSSYFFF